MVLFEKMILPYINQFARLLLGCAGLSAFCQSCVYGETPIKAFRYEWKPEPHVKEDRPEDMARFLNLLSISTHLTIFEGLPHYLWEKEKHSQELLRGDILRRDGYPFYMSALKVTDDDKKEIRELFAKFGKTSIYIAEGAKRCGGFHPDYLLVWSAKDEDSYSTLLCFGCAEIIISEGNFSIRRDIESREFLDGLKAILSKYRVSRPER